VTIGNVNNASPEDVKNAAKQGTEEGLARQRAQMAKQFASPLGG
jgi:hypothetical protein